jgi:chemotaxis protein histidine kinase CheA
MNLDPAPRQSKLVYFAIDAGLLITAFIIVFFAKNPYAPLPFVSAVLCIVLAAIIALIPLLIDYAADSAEYVQSERGRVTEQVQRLHAAGESLARAAAQIKAVEEAVHKTAHAAENLPYRMQEKLAEFNEALAEKENEEREALERELDELRAANSANLKAVADKIAKATAEWSTLEASSRLQLAAAQDAGAKLQGKLQATLAEFDSRISRITHLLASSANSTPPMPLAAPVLAPTTPPVAPVAKNSPPAEELPLPAGEPAVPTDSSVSEESKPRKPRAPRKAKPEDILAVMSDDSGSAEGEAASPSNHSAAAPDDESAAPADASGSKPESSTSSDGATRLLVTAYIGIGNKLFIRGDGPGLSWDKGVPMQFVSIGKWGWASHEATAPMRCKLYKNDESAALSGEVALEPGKHVEVTALF